MASDLDFHKRLDWLANIMVTNPHARMKDLQRKVEAGMNNLLDVMEDLYNSEINFEISSFWDAGYSVQIGDSTNGFLEQSSMNDTLDDVAHDLIKMAIKHYPGSAFSKKYGLATVGSVLAHHLERLKKKYEVDR